MFPQPGSPGLAGGQRLPDLALPVLLEGRTAEILLPHGPEDRLFEGVTLADEVPPHAFLEGGAEAHPARAAPSGGEALHESLPGAVQVGENLPGA